MFPVVKGVGQHESCQPGRIVQRESGQPVFRLVEVFRHTAAEAPLAGDDESTPFQTNDGSWVRTV